MDEYMERPIELRVARSGLCMCIGRRAQNASRMSERKGAGKVSGMRVTISWIRHAPFSSAARVRAEGGINKYIHTSRTHIHAYPS